MNKIVIFRKNEEVIINEVCRNLEEQGNLRELEIIKKNRNALTSLAESISFYPSLTETVIFGSSSRDINSLISKLCNKSENEQIFAIPTKGILGKSYLLAKVNFFYMINYIINENERFKSFRREINEIIKDIIYTLMAEELFLEIIADDAIDSSIKQRVSEKLIDIWEYRLDHGVKKFAPALDNLWQARNDLTPVYGSLLGTMEIMQLSSRIDPSMLDFLESEFFNSEERFALEEFLFGINFEELSLLRERMLSEGKTTVRIGEVHEMVGGTVFGGASSKDPREFYAFFLQRNNNAKFRAQADLTGPKKTLEEHIMLYVINK